MNNIKNKIQNTMMKIEKVSNTIQKPFGSISCKEIDSIRDSLVEIVDSLKMECITRSNKWRGRNKLELNSISVNSNATKSKESIKTYYDWIKRNLNSILHNCLPSRIVEEIKKYCDNDFNMFLEEYNSLKNVVKPNYEVINWNSDFSKFDFEIPSEYSDFSGIDISLRNLSKLITSMNAGVKIGRIGKNNGYINQVITLLNEILIELNNIANRYEKFDEIFDENYETIERYNRDFIEYIKNIKSKESLCTKMITGYGIDLKIRRIHKMLEMVQAVYNLKYEMPEIFIRFRNNKYADSNRIEEFKQRFSKLTTTDDFEAMVKKIVQSNSNDWNVLIKTLIEKISPIHSEYSQLKNDIDAYEKELKNNERKNKEEKVKNELKSIDKMIASEKEKSHLKGSKNVGLSVEQSYLLNYITEKLRIVLEEIMLYSKKINAFLNQHQTFEQCEEQIFQLYAEYEKIRGKFLGELAVFVEFISLSRFPNGLYQGKGEAQFNSCNLNNNNNIERKFLKATLPKLFENLEIVAIDNKAFMCTKNPNDAGVGFAYEFIKSFRNGINELYEKKQIRFCDGRIGNEFEEYYNKLITIVENKSPNYFNKVIKAVFYRLYMTFEKKRGYVTFPVLDEFNQQVYCNEHWFSKINGPNWEKSFMDSGSYQYYSTAYKLPPTTSYSEINKYILSVYRILYEIQFKFINSLCTDELIEKFQQNPGSIGYKK